MNDNSRLRKLRKLLAGEQLDAILISGPENRRYLSGFTGSAGYLLISQTDAVLATDFRYVDQAGRQAPDYRVERIPGTLDWFPELASKMGVKIVGFESQNMTFATHSAFQQAIADAESPGGLALVETSHLTDKMRATKSAGEIGLLSQAIKITDEAFEAVAAQIRPGVTEGEVAWELEKAMRERGAGGIGFDIIVGAGPNGALPHHRADETVISEGQPVVVDMGAMYEGYCADLTRTVVVGEPDKRFWEIYRTVLRAQEAAQELVAPGMTGAEVDTISRDIISLAGYEENFGHSLGHGVGLAVHEHPTLGPNATDVIEDGMMFTIEPGIYLSDWGGVRIEDIVVMENGHARVVSKAPKLRVVD